MKVPGIENLENNRRAQELETHKPCPQLVLMTAPSRAPGPPGRGKMRPEGPWESGTSPL